MADPGEVEVGGTQNPIVVVLIATIAYWFVFLFVLSVAISALKIPALTGFLDDVQSYLANIVAAVLIFVIAAVLAGAIGSWATRPPAASSAWSLILAIATFMVLNQLEIGPADRDDHLRGALGTLALAGGLASGLGGREVAGDMLRTAFASGQRNPGQVQRDVQTGRARGEQVAREQV